MDNNSVNNKKKEDFEIEVDLQRLLTTLLNRTWLIALVAVFCAVVTFVGTLLFVTPLYKSTAMFYVNNSSIDVGDVSISSITTGDLSASKNLVNSYIVILKTRKTLKEVIDYADVDLTYSQLRNMISASSVDNTEIFQVVVTSDDPYEAKKIADAIAYLLPKRITSIIEGTSAKVVDPAVVPGAPSSPNYTKNAMLGFLVGAAASVFVITLWVIVDTTIRKEEDIAQCCTYPVLAAVPDLEAKTKGSYYGYSRKENSAQSKNAQPELVGGHISFAAAEAYKLLRTKLQYSFTEESDCRIIGVSSALHGEGKSLTAVNLSHTLSQLGKRVLIIDCDMRRPTVAEKLPINKTPGLSDFLTRQSHTESLIQFCGIREEKKAFHAIASGLTPPNPMELLSSERMEKLLTRLRESYDYIILDLPPVGEVGDALATAKLTDGMLMVVRQNYCDRIALNTAVRQFEFVDAKILGAVFNCTIEEGGGFLSKYYRSRGYYKRYREYRRYYARIEQNTEVAE